VALRLKDYRETGLSVRLSMAANTPQELLPAARALFDRLYVPGDCYRATTVVLQRMESDACRQYDLFEPPVRTERFRGLGGVIDQVNARYGKHSLFTSTGLFLKMDAGVSDRETPCWRKINLLPGETVRRRIRIPMLDIKV